VHAENKADPDRNKHLVTVHVKNTSTAFIQGSTILGELHRFVSCKKTISKQPYRLEVLPVAYKVNYHVHKRKSLETCLG